MYWLLLLDGDRENTVDVVAEGVEEGSRGASRETVPTSLRVGGL